MCVYAWWAWLMRNMTPQISSNWKERTLGGLVLRYTLGQHDFKSRAAISLQMSPEVFPYNPLFPCKHESVGKLHVSQFSRITLTSGFCVVLNWNVQISTASELLVCWSSHSSTWLNDAKQTCLFKNTPYLNNELSVILRSTLMDHWVWLQSRKSQQKLKTL